MSLHASDDPALTSALITRRRFDLRSALRAKLERALGVGHLNVETPDGRCFVLDSGRPGPRGEIVLHRWRAVRRLLLGGDLGFAESYIDGDWSSQDLATLLALGAMNIEMVDRAARALWPVRALNRLRHVARRNSRRGSARNISEHYDLGNDFYTAWLDPGMTYSSALYRDDDETLEQAQDNKYRRSLELLALSGGEQVLEIGCGWGAMAEALLASGVGGVMAITLSREQRDYAIRRLGHDVRATVSLKDYRDIGGTYDRIVSIEMLEAVGEENWPRYFRVLNDRLKPGGTAVLQFITIADHRYGAYRRGADFIQRHIFPGGMLPSPAVVRRHIFDAGLTLAEVETFGESYARTLAVWRQRFDVAWPSIQALGFPTPFKRKWDYYLAYCEAGFRSGLLDVGLYRLEKPAGG